MGIRERLGTGQVSAGALRQYVASTSNTADCTSGIDDGGNWPGPITRKQNDDEATKTRTFSRRP